MTRTCNSGNYGCTGTKNDEFDPQGYFYVVRVGAAAVGTAGDAADLRPRLGRERRHLRASRRQRSHPTEQHEPYTPTDGITRYLKTRAVTEHFCTGDVEQRRGHRTRYHHVVRPAAADRHLQPEDATPMPACERQYPAYYCRGTRDHDRHLSGVSNKTLDQTTTPTLQRQRSRRSSTSG